VLQGNPLSPILFNIYIDGAIRELERLGNEQHVAGAGATKPFGIPLPRVVGRGNPAPWTLDRSLWTQADYLASLFYADDGALMSQDPIQLQSMLNSIVASLEQIGLRINTGKTVHLMVAGLSACKPNIFFAEKAALPPFLIGHVPIKKVTEFEYLGVLLNYRWNWDLAWADAIERANAALGAFQRAGTQHRLGNLHSQLAYAQAKIFSHFTYISALTGAGGADASAAWRKCIPTIYGTLQTIVGYTWIPGQVLEIESGQWDQQTRIDTLLLRFWCKLCCTPVESTMYRALCRSVYETRGVVDPESMHKSANVVHRQTWAQQLLAAAHRQGLDREAVLNLQVTAVVDLQSELNGAVTPLVHPSRATVQERSEAMVAMARPGAVTRWAIPGAPPAEHGHAQSLWSLPRDVTFDLLASTWSS
jgi:hypothetical protein